MEMKDYENAVIEKVKEEFSKVDSHDSVNKIYRQARIWNRLHYFFGHACEYDRYVEINLAFKRARWSRLEEIENGWRIENVHNEEL